MKSYLKSLKILFNCLNTNSKNFNKKINKNAHFHIFTLNEKNYILYCTIISYKKRTLIKNEVIIIS